MKIAQRCVSLSRTLFLCTLTAFIGVCSCYAKQPSAALAPPNTGVMFLNKPFAYPNSETTLGDVATALTKQCGISFVIDGQPVREKSALKLQGTVKEALDQMGEAFDYSWRLSKGQVVVMTKRFKDPDTHPQASLREMRESVRQILSALRLIPYNPDPKRWPQAVAELGESLMPQQMAVLKAGQYLSASTLSASQAQLMQEAILGNTFADQLPIWEELSAKLDGLPKSTLVAKPRSTSPTLFDVFFVYRDRNGKRRPEVLGELNTGQ